MGNLLTSLLNSSNALRVFQQALDVTENNVSNASTPGYAKQSLSIEARPFDISSGLPGGVAPGPMISSRDPFAEQDVRQQQTLLGTAQQKVSDLTPLESTFDLSGASGVLGAINGLFRSFSALSINPNDGTSRQAVLDQANQLSTAFKQSANTLAGAGVAADQQTAATVTQINQLVAQIAQINSQSRGSLSGSTDAGKDAALNSALEQLSQFAGVTALQQPDGTVSVYLAGQTPVVIGADVFPIAADFTNPASTVIRDHQGNDITKTLAEGQLGATLAVKNTSLPGYESDLNTLAKSVADQVNTTLAGGVDINGAAPVVNLFSYNAITGAAGSLAVTAITTNQIAAAAAAAPGGNGNALALAGIGTAQTINGNTFAGFYGSFGGRFGNELAQARDTQTVQESRLTQAQNIRKQISGVSLDQEASNLIDFQRSYQAAAKIFTVLDDLTNTVIGLIPAV